MPGARLTGPVSRWPRRGRGQRQARADRQRVPGRARRSSATTPVSAAWCVARGATPRALRARAPSSPTRSKSKDAACVAGRRRRDLPAVRRAGSVQPFGPGQGRRRPSHAHVRAAIWRRPLSGAPVASASGPLDAGAVARSAIWGRFCVFAAWIGAAFSPSSPGLSRRSRLGGQHCATGIGMAGQCPAMTWKSGALLATPAGKYRAPSTYTRRNSFSAADHDGDFPWPTTNPMTCCCAAAMSSDPASEHQRRDGCRGARRQDRGGAEGHPADQRQGGHRRSRASWCCPA